MNRLLLIAVVTLGTLGSGAGCAARVQYVPGTRIPYSTINEALLKVLEEYRTAVERGDADALVLMAHPQYWEDSGTPSGSDDYGFEGLRNVLLTRLQKVTDIRYSMRYLAVHTSCDGKLVDKCRAAVDVMIDASFTLTDPSGKPRRPDKRDQNQLVLEYDGSAQRWKFLSGM